MKKKSFKLFAFRLKYNFDVYLKHHLLPKTLQNCFFFCVSEKETLLFTVGTYIFVSQPFPLIKRSKTTNKHCKLFTVPED